MKIWHVVIEPLEERYSSDWLRWFKEEADIRNPLSDQRQLHGFIEGCGIREEIKNGSFLDVTSTISYKASQVQKIAKYLDEGIIREGDMLFFHDLWFPLEMIYYMMDALKIHLRIRGFLHAGTYDVNDFTYKRGMASWGADIERAWFREIEAIYVFSQYHADLVSRQRGVDKNQLGVVDFPYRWEELDQYVSEEKDIDVVFPHRLDEEKHPEIIKDLRNAGLNVLVTQQVCFTKKDYFQCLGRAKYAVSWAYQETYGIAMAEAYRLGAIPLVPNRLSYTNLFHESLRFDTKEELISTIQRDLNPPHRMVAPIHTCFRLFDPISTIFQILEAAV